MRSLSARLRGHYRDGWEAYGYFLAAVERLWERCLADELTVEFTAMLSSPVVDPAVLAPAGLRHDAKLYWCLGWCAHQATVGMARAQSACQGA